MRAWVSPSRCEEPVCLPDCDPQKLKGSRSHPIRFFFSPTDSVTFDIYKPAHSCAGHWVPQRQSVRSKDTVKVEKSEALNIPLLIRGSLNMTCRVCLEVVVTKERLKDRRYGILSDCNHCFCAACVRTFKTLGHHMCPICLTPSRFYISSFYWTVDKNAKREWFQNMKALMAQSDCRKFDGGRGTCPHSNCFFKHENRLEPWNDDDGQTISLTKTGETKRLACEGREDPAKVEKSEALNIPLVGICLQGPRCFFKHEEKQPGWWNATDSWMRQSSRLEEWLSMERLKALASLRVDE